jgi:hypothetical protein
MILPLLDSACTITNHTQARNNFLQEKAVEATKQKEEKRERLSPRNRKACHSVGTALLKTILKPFFPVWQQTHPPSHSLLEQDYG